MTALPASARQASLREANLALVLKTVLATPDPPSRADVAGSTSMTRSTVSRLVDELVAGGLLVELEQVASSGPGRPATPLAAGRGVAAVGLQVNASYLAVKVVGLDGAVLAGAVEPGDFVGSEPAPVLARLGRLAGDAMAGLDPGTRLVGAGLALPGIVSVRDGVLLRAPNLGWSDLRAADHLGGLAALGPLGIRSVPGVRGQSGDGAGAGPDTQDVRVGNEADLAALTVAFGSPGRPGPLADFIYLSGEIGIGGAVVVDSRVMAGRHGWAGEIGHVCVDPSGPPCPCGSTGCLERYAGRRAIADAAGLPHDAGPAELLERVRSGDRDASRALERAAWALGIALSGVVNVLDVPVIVLGGHLGQIADHLRPLVEPQLRTRVLSSRWLPPQIERANGDPAPGATGAALRELHLLVDHPARWL